MTILAADVGGTKTLVGLFEDDGRELVTRRFETGSFRSAATLFLSFLADEEVASYARPTALGVGVAGPVERSPDGRARASLTNYRLTIDSLELEAALGVTRAHVLNDFEAVATAVGYAADRPAFANRLAFVTVTTRGVEIPGGVIGVLGAGTGLGQAFVVGTPDARIVRATEGGHVTLAATDELDAAILHSLRVRLGGHVSAERVLSGSGLVLLHETLGALGAATSSQAVLDELAEAGAQAPTTITTHALAGDDPLCALALERFVAFYGAHAGNFALTVLATGGIYLAGGITPKILPFLEKGFPRAFVAKGRFEALLSEIPVHAVTNPSVGLLGAAIQAGRGA